MAKKPVTAQHNCLNTYHHIEYERVYLPLCKVTDTPFHIQWDYMDVFMHKWANPHFDD